MFLSREHLPDGREASPGTRGYGGAAPPQNRRNTSTIVITFAAMLAAYVIREILGITGITIRETGEAGQGARFEIAIPQGQYRVGSAQAEDRAPVTVPGR